MPMWPTVCDSQRCYGRNGQGSKLHSFLGRRGCALDHKIPPNRIVSPTETKASY